MTEYSRKHFRAPLQSRIHCSGSGVYFSDITANISEGGLGLRTLSKISEGDVLDIEFTLPETGQTIQVRSLVVWTKPVTNNSAKVDCGLKFDQIEDTDKTKIRLFVNSSTTDSGVSS